MKTRGLISLAAVISISGSAAMAATTFYDDFQGYTPGSPPPSPWVDGTPAITVSDYFNGNPDLTANFIFGNPNDHRWGASFYPIDSTGGGTAYARLRVNPYGGAQLALTENVGNYAYGINYTDDNVRFQLDDYRGTRDAYSSRIRVNGVNHDPGPDFPMVNSTWYDFRLTWAANHQDFTFEYKLTSDANYTLVHQTTTPEPLTFNYVGLSLAVYSSGNGAQWVGTGSETVSVPEETSLTEWYEDFQGYNVGVAPPSPWLDGTPPITVSDYFNSDTNLTATHIFGNFNDHRWGASFRPIISFGEGTAYARMRVNPGGGAQLALTENVGNYAYGIDYNGDSVRFQLDDYQGTRDAYSSRIRVNGVDYDPGPDFPMVNSDWYDFRITWTADRQNFTFDYKRDTNSVWTLAHQVSTPEPLTLNYVGLGLAVYDSGNGAQWVGYSLVPSKPSVADMQILQDNAAMEFPSLAGQPYLLEYTTDNASTWHSAGASLTGTGGNMYFYDPQEPTGSSTSKAYRIVTP